MKETHYKLKHRVTALFAAAVMLCSMLPGAAFAEEPTPQPTEETVQMEQQTEPSETDNGQTDESSPDPGEDVTEATPEAAEEQPAEEEIPAAVVGAELYTDLPNAPIGSYIGSEGLPVATGETKIGISEWPESQLEETSGSYLTAAALDNDGLTMAAPLLDGADYAIVPIMVQVEYPADGSTLDLVLPDSVTLLDYYGAPAADAESLLHSEYSETSAAVLGVYVQADANFTAQLVYTAPDGSTLTKTLNVTIDRNATAEYPFPDSEIAAFAERPTPAVTSGKITKVAKVNGTWLIWFNGEPAYCCTPGADGQPKNCPTYTYVNTSMVGADQYVPGDHYSNHETLGKLTIRKTGEILAGWKTEVGALDPWMTGEAEDGNFVYETRPLAGAEYTITAAEDIYTQDRQTDNYGNRTLWYAKGDVVAVVTTGDGSADIAAFTPARTKATYDFLSVIHDGTIGEVSVTLPLGSYHIEETKPPYGYIGTTESYDVTFAWDNELNDVVMATSIAKVDSAVSSQSFEVVRSKDANADFTEQQTLKFHNDREKAKVGVYKVDSETGNYLAGAVFNLYTADDIYSADGKLLFAAGELVATSPETGADGHTYFDCDIPIRGEYYGSSIRKDATTNSGNYIVKELRAPLGYYVNEEPMEVTFAYDGQAIMVLDNTCANKPTEMWVSKRDLTNDEELPGATLAIKDTDGNTVTTWVSTDEPHRVTGLHFGESYTLTEIRAADGYALANDITFRLIQKSDEDGNHLEECEVYYLTTKNILFWKWDDWKLLDDATVIMQDDITKVQISKKDLTTNEELPGAELVIKDKDGTEIDRWISTNGPHYVEKMPAGDYTLTEITAPNGYKVAESIDFTVLPTGEMQTVVMKDAREDTPTPTPDNTPTPDHTPQPTPNTTPAPTPVPAAPTATPTPLLTIPKTGDNSSLGLLLAIAGISLAGLAVLVHKSARRKDIAPRDDDDEDTED